MRLENIRPVNSGNYIGQMTMTGEDWADRMKYTYGKYCQRAVKGKFSFVCFVL